MNSKVVCYILLAVFAFQGATAGQRITRHYDEKGILDEAKAAIEKLKGIVQGAVDGAKAKLQELLDEARAFGESVIASGSLGLQQEADKVLAEIADLRKQAEELGVDIEKCIGLKEEEIKQLPITLAKELLECITDQINEAISIINDTVVAVESTWDTVTSLESNLDACDGGFFCTLDVIGDVSLEVVSLPVKVAGQIIKANDFISTIKTDLEACAISKVAQVALEAGLILADVVKCVGDLQSA